MPSKDYEDPVQIQVRKLLSRAMIQTFGLFEYKYDELVNKFMPVLPLPHDDCIDKVIQIVKGGQSVCVYEMKMEIVELQKKNPELVKSKKDIADRFTDTCAQISSGYRCHGIKPTKHSVMPIQIGMVPCPLNVWCHWRQVLGVITYRIPWPCAEYFLYSVRCTCRVNLCLCMCTGTL